MHKHTDRLEQDIDIGDVVRVFEHYEANPDDRWVIIKFIEWRTAIELVLENVNTKEIHWFPIWDIEKVY